MNSFYPFNNLPFGLYTPNDKKKTGKEKRESEEWSPGKEKSNRGGGLNLDPFSFLHKSVHG